MSFTFWLGGSLLLDCPGAAPSVDHLFPVRSPARLVEKSTVADHRLCSYILAVQCCDRARAQKRGLMFVICMHPTH